jgi:hypothetical protein
MILLVLGFSSHLQKKWMIRNMNWFKWSMHCPIQFVSTHEQAVHESNEQKTPSYIKYLNQNKL